MTRRLAHELHASVAARDWAGAAQALSGLSAQCGKAAARRELAALPFVHADVLAALASDASKGAQKRRAPALRHGHGGGRARAFGCARAGADAVRRAVAAARARRHRRERGPRGAARFCAARAAGPGRGKALRRHFGGASNGACALYAAAHGGAARPCARPARCCSAARPGFRTRCWPSWPRTAWTGARRPAACCSRPCATSTRCSPRAAFSRRCCRAGACRSNRRRSPARRRPGWEALCGADAAGAPALPYRIELRRYAGDRAAFLHAVAAALGGQNRPGGYAWELRVSCTADGQALVSVKPSAAPDARFAYRKAALPASIHPAMAAALAQAAAMRLPGRTGLSVYDPCCGSGTLLVEAAKALDCAALCGTDVSPAAVRAARTNLAAAGLPAQLLQRDCRRFAPSAPFDLVLSNLPFGNRVGSHAGNEALYRGLAARLPALLAPGALAVLYTMEGRLLERCLGAQPAWPYWTSCARRRAGCARARFSARGGPERGDGRRAPALAAGKTDGARLPRPRAARRQTGNLPRKNRGCFLLFIYKSAFPWYNICNLGRSWHVGFAAAIDEFPQLRTAAVAAGRGPLRAHGRQRRGQDQRARSRVSVRPRPQPPHLARRGADPRVRAGRARLRSRCTRAAARAASPASSWPASASAC